ncbi:unnamed protein product [Cercospora beticola]|nr:unnamed protein product [Cercospora beticola]
MRASIVLVFIAALAPATLAQMGTSGKCRQRWNDCFTGFYPGTPCQLGSECNVDGNPCTLVDPLGTGDFSSAHCA